MSRFSTRSLAGVALIALALVLFGAGLAPSLAPYRFVLAAAALLLTAGTYAVGTDVGGRPV